MRKQLPDLIRELRTPGTVETLCNIGRQLALRLDQIAAALGEDFQAGPRIPGRLVERGIGAEVSIRDLEYLMMLYLASYPRDHSEVTVTDAATPLVENKSMQEPAPIIITNNDHAHLLYYGGATVGVGKAPVIQPEQSFPITLPRGRTLYGIVATGLSITAAVSVLELPRLE